MSKAKRNRQKKQEKVERLQVRDHLKKHWIDILVTVVTAVISVLLTKACDRIIPDQPIVIEKIPDSIKVIHVHDPLQDSLSVVYNKSESPVENRLRNQIGNRKNDSRSHILKFNKVFPSADFPKAKGYSIKSAAPYFSLDVSPLSYSYVDFSVNFFDEEILAEIYCLSLKVCKVINGKSILILDEYFEKRTGKNVIRLKNIFGNEKYEIEVGFFFSKDKNSQYPSFYREIRYVNNKDNSPRSRPCSFGLSGTGDLCHGWLW